MQDSAETKEQPGATPVEPSTEIILRAGKPVQVARSKEGKFKRRDGLLDTVRKRKEILRSLLNQPEVGPDGKVRKGSKSRFHKILDNQIKNAMMDAERPVLDKFGNAVLVSVLDSEGNPILIDGEPLFKPVTVVDPKVMMASTQAFKELMLRSDGMPSKSEEDLEAMKTQGVKIVVIQPPEEMMNKTVVEDAPKAALKPAFIEGEFVENKS